MSETLTSAAEKGTSTQKFPGAPSLALTFLLAGLGFSLPIFLFPESHPLHGPVSSEILNLNFVVAWLGLAHFVFAFKGQARSLRQNRDRGSWIFCAGLIAAAALLFVLKWTAGARIFDFVIWVYFIPHFVKAELHFAKGSGGSGQASWVLYWFPALAFAFLTFALFGPKELTYNTGLLIALAALCVLAGVIGGISRQLYSDQAKHTLLAFFFIGEALVWGAYSKYMTPQFRQGVYVFHIAVASFYHYFRSYGFALRKLPTAQHLNRYLAIIVGVNLLVVTAGFFAVHRSIPFAGSLFDVTTFSFFVGLHLVASDLFGFVQKRNVSPMPR